MKCKSGRGYFGVHVAPLQRPKFDRFLLPWVFPCRKQLVVGRENKGGEGGREKNLAVETDCSIEASSSVETPPLISLVRIYAGTA